MRGQYELILAILGILGTGGDMEHQARGSSQCHLPL